MSSNASFPAGRHCPAAFPPHRFACIHRRPAEPDGGGLRLSASSSSATCACSAKASVPAWPGRNACASPDTAILRPRRSRSSTAAHRCCWSTSRQPQGLQQSAACRALAPALKVVAIAVAEVEQDILACAEAGVSGFVLREGSIGDVVAAVHNAMRDELVCSPKVAAALFGRLALLSARTVSASAGRRRRHADTTRARDHSLRRRRAVEQRDRASLADPQFDRQEPHAQRAQQIADPPPRRDQQASAPQPVRRHPRARGSRSAETLSA